jgi:hypothetical protein
VEWLKVKVLSSSPIPPKKKNENYQQHMPVKIGRKKDPYALLMGM